MPPASHRTCRGNETSYAQIGFDRGLRLLSYDASGTTESVESLVDAAETAEVSGGNAGPRADDEKPLLESGVVRGALRWEDVALLLYERWGHLILPPQAAAPLIPGKLYPQLVKWRVPSYRRAPASSAITR